MIVGGGKTDFFLIFIAGQAQLLVNERIGPSPARQAGRRGKERRTRLRFRLSPPASRRRRGLVGGDRDGVRRKRDGEVVQGAGHGARQVPQRD